MMEIARECGWETGSRSDDTIYPAHRPLALLDIHWKQYDWQRHLQVAREERPDLCAVPDIERREQLSRVLEMMEEVAPYCERVLVIPKAFGVTASISARVGGKTVVLGYSVPSRYGGTTVPLCEFEGFPVHLLGGSPRQQRRLAMYRSLRVESVDGNMAAKVSRHGKFYSPAGRCSQTIEQADGMKWEGDMPYEALRRSLVNLRVYWREN